MSSFSEALKKFRAETTPKEELEPVPLAQQPFDFLRSLGYAAVDPVGIEAPADVIRYRRLHPGQALVSEIGGVLIPYTGAYKAVSSSQKLGRLYEGISASSRSPITKAFLEEAAKVGTIEAGRIPISQVLGEDSIADDLGYSAINVLGGGLLAGGFRALGQGGPIAKGAKDLRGVQLGESAQEQIRQLRASLEGADPETTSIILNRISTLSQAIRNETSRAGRRYVEGTKGTKGYALNRLFNTRNSTKSNLIRRKLAQGAGEDAFSTTSELEKRTITLPEGWEAYTQFPRSIAFKTEQAAKDIETSIESHMTKLGDGWFITREKDDGLYVMARKIRQGAKTKAQDEWIVFKTDKPGIFRSTDQEMADLTADLANFISKEKPVPPVTPIDEVATGFQEKFDINFIRSTKPGEGSIGAVAERLSKRIGVDKFAKGHGELFRRLHDLGKEFLVPSAQQFTKSARATKIFAGARATYDAAEGIAQKIVLGETSLDPTKRASQAVFMKGGAVETKQAIDNLIDGLEDLELEQFRHLWKEETSPEAIVKLWEEGKITGKVKNLAEEFNRQDETITKYIMDTHKLVGKNDFVPKVGHFGLSREWDGTYKVALYGDDGKPVGLASGFSRQQALERANKLQKGFEDQGQKVRLSEVIDAADPDKIPDDVKQVLLNPKFLKQRRNFAGYRWYDEPIKKNDLKRVYLNGLSRRMKYVANQTVAYRFADDLAKLAVEDPLAHRILVGRLNDLAGVPTPSAVWQNKVTDKILGAHLGGNSATQIATFSNSALWHWELGGLRIAYPAINATTFISTVLPEISMVANASPEVLAKYYVTSSLHGLKTSGPAHFLDPMKLWVEATRLQHSKDPLILKLTQRAVNERIIDPRYIEEYVGESAVRVSDLKKALSGEGFLPWLKSMSEYLPGISEKWSRHNAFSTGIAVGKDLLKITDDDVLYEFAKEFSDRTMFRYGVDARARILTNPAGSVFGAFKNWMMHYIGLMLNYTEEGVMRNNWNPLIWQTMGTAALGGATALPLYSLANAANEWFNDESLMTTGYDAFAGAPDRFSDGLFFGLPALLTGQSISSSVEAPTANPMRDATMLFSFVHMNRANALGKAFGGAVDAWRTTGEHPGRDPNTRDQLARALAPKTLYRAIAAAEDNSIRSLTTSYPTIQNVGLGDRLAYTFGFNPVELEKAYSVSNELWRDKEKRAKAVARYGEQVAIAYKENDQEALKALLMKATAEGIDVSSIERSASTRLDKAQKEVFERGFSDEEVLKRVNIVGKEE